MRGRDTLGRLTYLNSVKSDAENEIAIVRGTLDYFENLKVPAKLKNEHEDLLKAIDNEREFMDSLERLFESGVPDELKRNSRAPETALETEDSDGAFPQALERFMKRIDDVSGFRKAFVWI